MAPFFSMASASLLGIDSTSFLRLLLSLIQQPKCQKFPWQRPKLFSKWPWEAHWPSKAQWQPFFLLLRTVCLSSHTWLRLTGKCDLGSCIILVTKTVIQHLERWNFIWNIPRHRKTKCNCPQGPSSKGKARGIKYVPVMFYCGDCISQLTQSFNLLLCSYFSHIPPYSLLSPASNNYPSISLYFLPFPPLPLPSSLFTFLCPTP